MYITKQQSFLFLVLISLPWSWLAAQTIEVPPGWKIKQTWQATTIEPENLPSGKSFSLVVGPQRAPSNDFQAWFTSETDADVRQYGAPQPGGQVASKEEAAGLFFLRDFKVRTDAGQMIVLYFARKPQRAGGMVRLGKAIANDDEMMKSQLVEALTIAMPALIDESRSTGITVASTTGSGNQSSTAPQPSATGSKPPATNTTKSAPPPGRTLTPAEWKVVYKPEGLERGESFTYEVRPPRNASGDFEAWFISETDADIAQLGTAAPFGAIDHMESGRVFMRFKRVDSPSGSLFLIYAACKPQQPGSAMRMGRAIGNSKSVMDRYAREAMRSALPMLIEESRSTATTPTSTPVSGNQVSTTSRTPGASSEPPAPNLPLVKAPATGYQIILQMDWDIGVGGMPYDVFVPYLLLADGQVVPQPEVPPGEFDVETFKRQPKKRWGRWRQSGDKYLITWSDGRTKEFKDYLRTVPGRADQRLDAHYFHYSGMGFAGSAATGWSVMKDLRFRRDGTFEIDRGAAVTAGTAGDISVMGTNNRSNSGTYRIDGNVIEFHYRDGRKERRSFYFGAKSDGAQDPNVIGIGSSIYYEKDKK